MPQYSYTTSDGQTIQRCFSIGQAPAKVTQGGRTFHRDIAADFRGNSSNPSISGEITSRYSMGVLPSQAAAAQAEAERLGCKGVRYGRDGRPTFDGPAAKRDFMLKHGFVNKDPGYRDVTPDDVNRFRAARGDAPIIAGEWPE